MVFRKQATRPTVVVRKLYIILKTGILHAKRNFRKPLPIEKELMERSLILSLPKNVAGPSGKAFVDIYSVLRKQFPATSTWINIQGVCVCLLSYQMEHGICVWALRVFSPQSKTVRVHCKKIYALQVNHTVIQVGWQRTCAAASLYPTLCDDAFLLLHSLSQEILQYIHPSYDQMLLPYKSCMCVLCDMVQPLCLHIANGH